ncbi:unnamed protein product, partial [Prorocentrum cordatum]
LRSRGLTRDPGRRNERKNCPCSCFLPAALEAPGPAAAVLGAAPSARPRRRASKEAPSADQVIGQLRSVAAELEDIVQQRASSSRTLVQGGVPEQLLSMVGCTSATGWRLHETEVLEPRAPVGTAVDGCEGFRPPARTD